MQFAVKMLHSPQVNKGVPDIPWAVYLVNITRCHNFDGCEDSEALFVELSVLRS